MHHSFEGVGLSSKRNTMGEVIWYQLFGNLECCGFGTVWGWVVAEMPLG
jgi:hypothetical protein